MVAPRSDRSMAILRRVTVVDDSPEILELFDALLGGAEADVTLLGISADIEQIEHARPELLVIDLRLGTDHLPGWELVRQVRSHAQLGDVPVIVCSGALDQMRDHGGPSAGWPRTYLLPKPFSLTDLDAVLAQALEPVASAPRSSGWSPGPIPRFADDPYGWFGWVGQAVLSPDWVELMAQLQPDVWNGVDGHAWRVVRTAWGVEVRPELTNAFLRFSDLPLITALAIGDGLKVELTTRSLRWVDRFERDAFDVAAMGRAMLDEQRLSHDNLARLFPPRSGPEVAAFSIGVGSPSRLRG